MIGNVTWWVHHAIPPRMLKGLRWSSGSKWTQGESDVINPGSRFTIKSLHVIFVRTLACAFTRGARMVWLG